MKVKSEAPALNSTGTAFADLSARFAEVQTYWRDECEGLRLAFEARHPRILEAGDEPPRRERGKRPQAEALADAGQATAPAPSFTVEVVRSRKPAARAADAKAAKLNGDRKRDP